MGVFTNLNTPKEKTTTKTTTPAVKTGGVFSGLTAAKSVIATAKPGGSSSVPTGPSGKQIVTEALKGVTPSGQTKVPKKIIIPNKGEMISQGSDNSILTDPAKANQTPFEKFQESITPSFVKERSQLTPEQESDNININIPFTKERVLTLPNLDKSVAKNSKGVGEFVGNLPDVVAESVPRGVVSTGLAINPFGPDEIDPTTLGDTGERIFGNKPIKNFTGVGNDAGVENKYLAPFVGFGLTALDLYPGTSGKAKLLTNLAKDSVEQSVKETLIREVRSLAPEIIDEIAPIIAKSQSRQEIDTILNNAVKEYKRMVEAPKNFQDAIVRDVAPQADNVPTREAIVRGEPVQAQPEGARVDPEKPTLKTLDKLNGRTVVSKQFIMDLTNSGSIKQSERDIIRKALEEYPDGSRIAVANFLEKAQDATLPLKTKAVSNPKYEMINLPEDIRGDVKNYSEHIYESPIQTSAGSVHFRGTGSPRNYFGHVRVEDLPDNETRRILEVQSDLYQKGRLEQELNNKYTSVDEAINDLQYKGYSEEEARKKATILFKIQGGDVNKLAQYNNPTAHLRMVREEIKRAAKDNIETLQFPTGETAMKIEGLGGRETNWFDNKSSDLHTLTNEDLIVGKEVRQGGGGDDWVITEVIGDGKFKAVPRSIIEATQNNKDLSWNGKKIIGRAYEDIKPIIEHNTETFDISNRIDTNNPIYKFYEKELATYLKNKYNATKITDANGVTWYKMEVNPKAATEPVEAFQRPTRYQPFTRGPKMAVQDVEKALSPWVTKENIQLIFDKNLIKEANALGMFSSRPKMEYLNDKMKPIIALFENNGKVYARTVFHELNHYLEDKVFSKEFRRKLDEETLAVMNEADHEFYKKRGYKTELERAAEYRSDEFGRIQAKKAGYVSPLEKVWDMVKEAIKAIVDTGKKFRDYVVSLPNKQGGFVKTGEKKLSAELEEKARLIEAKRFALENVDRSTISKAEFKSRADELVALKKQFKQEKYSYEAKQYVADPKNNPANKGLEKAKEIYKSNPKAEEELNNLLVSLELAEKGERMFIDNVNGPGMTVSGKPSTFPKWIPENLRSRTHIDKLLSTISSVDTIQYPKDVRATAQKEFVDALMDQMDKSLAVDTKAIRAAKGEINRPAEIKKAVSEFVAEKPKKPLAEQVKSKEPVMAPEPKKSVYPQEKVAEITKALDEFQKKITDERDYKARATQIRREADLPQERGNSLFSAIQRSLNPINFTDRKTKEIFTQWKRDLLVGKELAQQDFNSLARFPKGEGMKVINAYEAGKNTPYTNEIKAAFDKLHKEASERGLETGYRENYLPHVYKESPAEIKNLIGVRMAERGIDQITIMEYLNGVGSLSPEQAKALKMKPSFIKERVFDTYAAAAEYGLHPKYEDPAQLMAHYRAEMEKAISNANFMKKLEIEGKIMPEGMAPRTWKEINLTYGGKRWFADKRFADVINGQIVDPDNMGAWSLFVNKVANLSKGLQDLALSAGVPKSNINFFSTGQVIKNITSGDFKAAIPYLRANFTNASIKYFERNQDVLKAMARQGIDLGGRVGTYGNLYDSFLKKWRAKEYKEALGFGFDKVFNEKTFGAFMPQLYMGTFKSAFKAAEKKGLSKEAAEVFAGNTVKKFYGLIEESGRSELTKDALAAVFFAPKFRESLINTLLNTARSATTQIRNPEFYLNRRLLAGMALTFAAYNLMNRELNDGKNMWENEPGREMSLRIPGPNGDVIYLEFMPSFLAFARSMITGTVALAKGDLTTARQKYGSVFSMPIKLVNDVITNRDYFGREIYKEDDDRTTKAMKIASYIGLQANHPYVEELLKQVPVENKTARSLLGIPDERPPLYQTISTMFEFPLKFTSQSQLQKNQIYTANRKIDELHKAERAKFKPKFDEIQTLINTGDEAKAQEQLNALTEAEYKIYKDTMATNKRSFRIERESAFLDTYNKIQDLKLKGNREAAMKIVDSLTDDQYQTYSDLADRYDGRTTTMIIDGKKKPKFGERTEISERGLFDTVITYAHAIGVDPVTAFDDIMAGEKIRRVDNGVIVVERMSLEESEAEKKKTGSNNSGFKLDHTIPLQLGGTNGEDNLRIVPTEDWAKYTPIENYLGKELRNDRMSKKEVQDLITKFKLGQMTAEEVYNYKPKK